MPGAPAGPAHLLGFRLDPSITYAGNLSEGDLDLDAGRGDAGKTEWIISMPDLLFSNYLGGKLDHLGINNQHTRRPSGTKINTSHNNVGSLEQTKDQETGGGFEVTRPDLRPMNN